MKYKYPEEILLAIHLNTTVSFEFYSQNRHIQSRKAKVLIKCISCSEMDIMSFKELHKRTNVKDEVCRKCSLKYATNSKSWREHNRGAQLKIQSTPEQKLKNALGVSKFWREHPEKKELARQKMLENYQNSEKKKAYLKNHKHRGESLTGTFSSLHYGDTWFGSSYELCFLVWIDKQENIQAIRRCNFWIPYQIDNRTHHYQPDYLVIYKDKKILYEIKSNQASYYNQEIVNTKAKAARIFCINNDIDEYFLIDENHPLALEIQFVRSCRIRLLCKILHNENRITLDSETMFQRYIGKCRFRGKHFETTKEKYLT